VFSADDLGNLQKLLSQLGLGDENAQADNGNKQDKRSKNNYNNNDDSGATKNSCPRLDPAQILVIGGILSGGLLVRSVWVNDDQTVQFVLTGNLKRKTQLEKVMGLIGQLPFDKVIKAIMDSVQ
jgi:hypothetical protein